MRKRPGSAVVYSRRAVRKNGKRAGTENVAGIVGMAKALEIAVEEMQVVRPRIVRLRNYFCGTGITGDSAGKVKWASA